MPAPELIPDLEAALVLVHEGWEHLKLQRPLAAWASWQRALRVSPGSKAAEQALARLASAGDLPEVARAEYRFLTPSGEDQRRRWDAILRTRDLGDLQAAAEAFEELALPGGPVQAEDGAARFNQGLCLAWLGLNGEATEALDRCASAFASDWPEQAVTAWALAEVIRQGAGAERFADDLNHSAVLALSKAETPEVDRSLGRTAEVRAVPVPVDPASGRPARTDVAVFEWLDRPMTAGAIGPPHRVLANVIRSSGSIRLSGPDPVLVDRVLDLAGLDRASTRREANPLPLAFLDAAVWSIRTPDGLDPDEVDRLNRLNVEQYYEATWINRPRIGLEGLSPIDAARRATGGDAVMMVKLVAVIRVREQLGERPSTARLYQGYPFDRLRRRLGLEAVNPELVDPLDPSTMSPAELDRLDPSALAPESLAEAYESAATLGDDARTAKFAAAIVDRSASTIERLDASALFATLVRRSMGLGEVDQALGWVDRAIEADRDLAEGRHRRKFSTWRAEIFARSGRLDAAILTYRQILDERPDAPLALDAAETLIDNGFVEAARAFAEMARDLALDADDRATADRAEMLL